MKEVTIGVYHQDCWGSGSAEKFPESVATVRGPVVVTKNHDGKTEISCTMETTFNDNKQRDSYLDYVKNHELMKKFNVFHKTDSKAIFSTSWKGSTSYGSVVENSATYTAPITQEQGGYETHTVLTKKPKDLKKLLAELEILGEVKILKVKNLIDSNNPYNLTDKQAKALRIARTMDYYSWPRNITLEELASYAGTTRRAFQENLRKAEAKVFPTFLNKELSM